MDPRIIDLYNDELMHLRTETREFAREYPERAARLSIDDNGVEDPYVERLLEGVAYLAARVRLKLDAQYPIFTQQLLEVLFPGWLASSPSSCVLKLTVDASDDKLNTGLVVPRQSVVVGSLRGNDSVSCDFLTSRALSLWPLAIRQLQYFAARPDLAVAAFANERPASSLRLELEVLGDSDLARLPMDALPLYITKPDAFGSQLMELLAGRCMGVALSTDPTGRRIHSWLKPGNVRQIGFEESEAMFPMPVRGHAGFRILKEYAALPDKFRFVEISGLRAAMAGITGRRLFLTFYFSGAFPRLESAVKADALALFCVPAVNLREQQLDRVDVTPGQVEFHVVADRMRARDKEVVQIVDVRGGGSGSERRFQPIFESVATGKLASASYYSARRVPQMTARTETYAGTETYLALTETGAAPYGRDLQYLSIRALCSSRGLPLYLKAQASDASYAFANALPITQVECVAGPSVPLAPAVDGFEPWLALSHLFVNHLSLFDAEPTQGGEAVRAMLGLYATAKGHFLLRQAEGLTKISARQITRRVPGGGPIAFGRGVEVTLSMSDRAFDGGSPFLLAAVLEHFMAAHVSINSFVETGLELVDRAERLRWPTRFGRRPTF